MQEFQGDKIRDALREKSFEYGSILSAGCFGQVVKASKNGEAYAIKLMNYAKDNTEEARTMLKYQKQELELLERMKLSGNSNVIKYFESWLMQVGHATMLCIQMEWCWTNLREFVYNNEASPEFIRAKGHPRFYRHVFQQLLNGLHAIHSIGWVHRNIHPGNILVVNPNPQQISDIAIKIGGFGLAKYIGIEWSVSAGGTINLTYEKLTPFLKDMLYTAPELSNDNYDSKVDLYSAGLVLYFISRYFEKNENKTSTMMLEIRALKEGTLKIKEYVYHKDDEELCGLIENLTDKDRHKRRSALEAMEYMFPTQAKDSTDASGVLNEQFYARTDGEDDLTRCSLNKRTLSALIEAVRSRIGVIEEIWQECVVNKEKRRVKIERDQDVENMFLNAKRGAEDERHVVVVVRVSPIVSPHEDSNVNMEQPEPGEGSSQDFPHGHANQLV